jgi:hypothetical protein
MVQVQKTDISHGVAWVTDGFRNFMKHPGLWIVLGLALLIIYILLSLIPLIGTLLVSLISPILTGGLLYAAKESAEGRPIEFVYLFRGFQDSRALNGLLALGGVVVAGTIASLIVIFMLLGTAFMAGMQGGTPDTLSPMVLGVGGLIGLLLVLSIQLVVVSAVVYAVPLVMLKGTAPGEAMSASINACLTNFLPLTIFGVIYIVIAIIASLPIMLGWIVLAPASIGMLYASYRDSFGA